MRKLELIVGGLVWLALAVLMPMTALEPVQVPAAATAQVVQ